MWANLTSLYYAIAALLDMAIPAAAPLGDFKFDAKSSSAQDVLTQFGYQPSLEAGATMRRLERCDCASSVFVAAAMIAYAAEIDATKALAALHYGALLLLRSGCWF